MRLRRLLLVTLFGAIGCKPNVAAEPEAEAPVVAAPSNDPESIAKGAVLYGEMCAVCHGARGEGGRGPKLAGWSTSGRSGTELVKIIAEQMPKGQVGRCTGTCAQRVAAFVISDFAKPPALTCDREEPAPRRLRLLTRVEYRNTVSDLFAKGGSAKSGPCGTTTFTFHPEGRTPSKVHVAGTFNAWPSTIAAGGWPMTKSGDVFTLVRTLTPGTHQYKFVLDDGALWLEDTKNPAKVSDGHGGSNSVLSISCGEGGAGLGFDPTVGFPPDARPEGFAFDVAEGRVITALHLDELRRAGKQLAEYAVARLDTLVACKPEGDGSACADQLVRSIGRRAFRRPLLDAEIARYRSLVTARKDFAHGASLALQAMLISPAFLYRSELGVAQPDGTHKLTGYEVASALSYTLWQTMPDEALFAAAEAGELDAPAGIEKHARRLLDDPRARDAIGDFALQWTGARSIATADKKPELFPEATAELRASLVEETRRFVAHVIFDSTHALSELFTAPYTFVDERLSGFYGMPGITGGEMRQAPYADGRRAGLLAHASVLGTAAHSDQSSPIRRGLLVRRAFLCQDLPPPPPDAGGVPDVDPKATTKERFAQHTARPVCASCHRYIDPIGFGFERFDALGRWREAENGLPIDAAGDLGDVEGLGTGTHHPFASIPELGAALGASESAKTCFAKQWLRYARGHREGEAEICSIEVLRRKLAASGGDLRSVMIGSFTSSAFASRK